MSVQGQKRTLRHVRFNPEGGHWLSASQCPLCAKGGLMHRSNRSQRLSQLTSNPSGSLVPLSWLKAFGTEHRSGNRSSEELDKRFVRIDNRFGSEQRTL